MQARCAESALIDLDSFPFQQQFGDKNLGFERKDLLAHYGISAADTMSPVSQAIDLLETETNQEKCPLVSLQVFLGDLPQGWHIYVAARQNNELVLIDPAPLGGKIYKDTRQDLTTEFQRTLDYKLDRGGIHLLTYTVD